jgi:predicted DsbA family dithiol-disulfide isomerase
MDDEVFEKAKEEDLTLDEAEQLQDLVDETGLNVDDVEEILESGGL